MNLRYLIIVAATVAVASVEASTVVVNAPKTSVRAALKKTAGKKSFPVTAAIKGKSVKSVVRPKKFGPVSIETDWRDCLDGRISMDVDVRVDGEQFSFSPSCSFSFDNSFTTKKGRSCEVSAGMCSAFSPEKRFEVSCEGLSDEGVDIQCPGDFKGDIEIDADLQDCVDGWMSMDIKISVGGESKDLDLSCGWREDRTFQTRAGGTCRVLSGMCSGWSPERRLDITCEKGQKASMPIMCPTSR